MSNQFLKLRRSAVPGRIPTTSSLDFGEIALNTYDGLAFMKKSGSSGEQIVTLGAGTGTSGSFTGSFSGSFTGSLFGTASWAQNAVTSSYILNAVSASFATTASYIQASGVVGLNLSQISLGVVTASVSTGSNIFNIISGSNTLVVVDTTGSVGIGITSPTAKLDVLGAARLGGGTIIGRTTTGVQSLKVVASTGDSTNVFSVTNESQASTWFAINGINGIASITSASIGNSLNIDSQNISIRIDTPSQVSANFTVKAGSQNFQNRAGGNLFLQGGASAGAGDGVSGFISFGTTDSTAALGVTNTISEVARFTINKSMLIGTTTDVTSSILTINSTTKGVLLPRMTAAQRTAISSPAQGLLVYDTGSVTEGLWLYGSGSTPGWQEVLTNTGSQSILGGLTATSFTGSLFGTASWANNAITASYISASGIVGLSLSQISLGAITASVNAGSNVFNIISGSNTLVVVDGTGSMGIGTTSPGGYKLDVNGTLRSGIHTFRVNQGTIYYSSTVYIQLATQGGPTGGIFADGGYGWAYNNGSQTYSGLTPGNGSTIASTWYLVQSTAGYGKNAFYITTDLTNAVGGQGTGETISLLNVNNLGAATGYAYRPSLKLRAGNSGTHASADTYALSGHLYLEAGDANAGTATNISGGNIYIKSGRGTGTGTSGDIIISTATPTGSGTTLQPLTDRVWIKGDIGNVGIGASPNAAYKLDISGSFRSTANSEITGSLTVTQGITGSLFGTSSWANNVISASFASTSSLPLRGLITASVAGATITFTKGDSTTFDLTIAQSGTVSTASYVTSSGVYGPFGSNSILTASYATTASYALNGGVTQIIAGTNVTISPTSGTGSVTINATGGGGAAFPFTGSALITGSLVVTGSTTSTLGFTGSLFGTSSWAQNAVSASFAATASSVTVLNQNVQISGSLSISGNAGSTIFSSNVDTLLLTGSALITGSVIITGSLSVSGSITGLLFGTASWANNATTASYILNAVSASFAATASYISASGVVGLTLSQISLGVVTASVNTGTNIFSIVSGSNTLVVVDNTGSVGIGTTSPGYKLDVTGVPRFWDGTSGIKIHSQTISGLPVFTGISGQAVPLPSTTNYGLVISNNGNGVILNAGQYTQFEQSGTARMLIAYNTGNIIIQNGGTYTDIASARLQISSTTQGVLLPRMTAAQRTAISSPAQGLLVYDTGSVTEGLWLYNSGSTPGWQEVLTNTGSQSILGGLTATSFTGSLFGTSSWANNAVTSSYILNAVSSSFAATSSYILQAVSSSFATTASYALNGGVTQIVAGTNVTISPTSGTGSVTINATAGAAFPFTGSALITGSLTVTGSISTTSTLNIGNSQFNNTSSVTSAGTTIVSQLATGSFTSAFYNYTIASASNARSGQVMSVWNGATVRYTEVTTTDTGNTATASFAVVLSGANVQLNFTAPGSWTVKNISNLL
jgi:hypothetical protein